MIKHIQQQLSAQAKINHAAIIKNSQEQKGERKESVK